MDEGFAWAARALLGSVAPMRRAVRRESDDWVVRGLEQQHSRGVCGARGDMTERVLRGRPDVPGGRREDVAR